MSRGLEIAVLGAVGLNGDNLLQLIGERGLPVARLRAFDSGDYLGRRVDAGGKMVPVEDYRDADFAGVDVALACTPLPGEVVERALGQGCTLVGPADWLGEASGDSPLVVADLNASRATLAKGSAIPVPSAVSTVLASLFSPLHDEAGLREVNATWIAAVGNDGPRAVEGLAHEAAQLLSGKPAEARAYADKIAFNLLARDVEPEATAFQYLWQGLWGDSLDFALSYAVAPLFFGDLISLTFTTEQSLTREELRQLLGSVAWLEMVEEKRGILLGAAGGVGSDRIRLAGLRALNGEGNRFALWAGVDGPRFGLAANLVKIVDILAKKLFISYS